MEENKTIRIHTAQPNDFADCLPLFVSLYHGDIGPNFQTVFNDFIKEGVVLIADAPSGGIKGILVGSFHLDIDWEGRIARIDALIVEETYRRRGVGHHLASQFIGIARKSSCKAVKSRINTKNVAAQQFHARLGFRRADTFEYFLDFEHEGDPQ